MLWVSRYIPPENTPWHGRSDTPSSSCFFQIIQMLNLTKDIKITNTPAFGLIGFRCDEGIRRNLGRPGAVDGPVSIREVLAKLPVPKPNLVCYDAGDITCADGDLESSQLALAETVALLLQHNIIPIVLGGGHELAFGNYLGIAIHYPHENLGIINFDAHFDMRPLLPEKKGSSGTPFLQIADACKKTDRRFDYNCLGIQKPGNIPLLFETAKQHHVQVMLAEELQLKNQDNATHFIDRVIKDNDLIYTTLCLDVFAAAYAPGVSAPQALGVTPWQVIPLIRQLAASGKVISYDIAELSPAFDVDHRTAKLAANFIYEIIQHHEQRI